MRADKLKQEFIERLKRKGTSYQATVEYDPRRYDSAGGYEINYPPDFVWAETDAEKVTVADLQEMCKFRGIPYSGKTKAELIEVLSDE